MQDTSCSVCYYILGNVILIEQSIITLTSEGLLFLGKYIAYEFKHGRLMYYHQNAFKWQKMSIYI